MGLGFLTTTQGEEDRAARFSTEIRSLSRAPCTSAIVWARSGSPMQRVSPKPEVRGLPEHRRWGRWLRSPRGSRAEEEPADEEQGGEGPGTKAAEQQ